MNKGSGTGPRWVITMGGLPGGTPRDGCRPGGTGWGGRGGGGGPVALASCDGLGVGIFTDDADEDDEDDAEEQTAWCSDGDPDADPDGPADVGPPGDGALRRSSLSGVLQDSGVRSCTPPAPPGPPAPPPSPLPPSGPGPRGGGLHRPPGRAACVSL